MIQMATTTTIMEMLSIEPGAFLLKINTTPTARIRIVIRSRLTDWIGIVLN